MTRAAVLAGLLAAMLIPGPAFGSDRTVKATFAGTVSDFNQWWSGYHTAASTKVMLHDLNTRRAELVADHAATASARAGRMTAVRAIDHLIASCEAWSRYLADLGKGMAPDDPLPYGEHQTQAREAQRAQPLLETAGLQLDVRIKVFRFTQ